MANNYDEAIKGISGLTHYYPLVKDAKDTVGSLTAVNNGGVTFSEKGAKFTGANYLDLGDHDDFSVATKGAFSIALYLTIADWKGKGASEYVHWMGKGEAGKHEWTFRHYVKGGSGEAASRQGRMSFYHFNPAGGLGAGSYYQDSTFPTTERLVVATCDMKQIQMYVNGVKRDTDALSGYSVVPKNTASKVRIGTRDMSTGFLVGTVRRVGFFNKVLSAAEVTALYAARTLPDASGGVTPPEPKPPEPEPPTPSDDYKNYLVPVASSNPIEQLVAKHNLLVLKLHEEGVI